MPTITLTVTVTPEQFSSILSLLSLNLEDTATVKSEPTTSTSSSSIEAKETEPIEGIAVRKKGGRAGPKMAAFGRTTEQLQTYADNEESRTEKIDEDEEVRIQRKAERATKNAIKEKEDAEKLAEEQKELDEIEAIKAKQAANDKVGSPVILKKPWIKTKD